jgi:hypothetical protein
VRIVEVTRREPWKYAITTECAYEGTYSGQWTATSRVTKRGTGELVKTFTGNSPDVKVAKRAAVEDATNWVRNIILNEEDARKEILYLGIEGEYRAPSAEGRD